MDYDSTAAAFSRAGTRISFTDGVTFVDPGAERENVVTYVARRTTRASRIFRIARIVFFTENTTVVQFFPTQNVSTDIAQEIERRIMYMLHVWCDIHGLNPDELTTSYTEPYYIVSNGLSFLGNPQEWEET